MKRFGLKAKESNEDISDIKNSFDKQDRANESEQA
jgi:hypothetical protein